MGNFASSVDLRATKSAALGLLGEDANRSIRIRGLNHYYGKGDLRKQVLFNNNLDIYEGQIVIMTGPSGSGKTTLLTLMGTLRTVQEGSLRVFDRELFGASPEQLVKARRDVGFIFQAHNLFGSLTALQNVRMAMELFDFTEAEMQQRATELLSRLGLGQRLHYKPSNLSGGQKQRVAIARGLAHGPKIVLADEPTAALDEHSGREVVTLLKELASEQKMSILIVTHDNRILDVADRIVNMVDGRIKSDVNVKEAAVICEFLAKCPVFAQLTPRTLTEVADKMFVEEFRPGAFIIRQGDQGDKFYLIRQGSVEVHVSTPEATRVVATLASGDFFGETALLTGAPRNASVIAREDTVLYALGKDDFNAVLA